MKRKDIIDAYCRIRTIDNTIPDEVLNFMKDSALAALPPDPIGIEINGLPFKYGNEPLFLKHKQEYEEDLYCSECGNDGETFVYQRTVANGEVWLCNECNQETITREEPKPNNY